MILPKAQAKRFFRLFDYLTIYAHRRLRVVSDPEFFNGEPPQGISMDGMRLTMRELWENPGVIEDFVLENPNDLDADDLAIVRSWTNAYPTVAYADRCDDGRVRFLVDDHVVDVCGMSLDLDGVLPEVPCAAHMTLLPYGDHIVYAQAIEQLPFGASQEMLDIFAREMREAWETGRTIRTGQELCDIVPALKQRHLDAKMEQFRHEMELEEHANDQRDGQHRGVLAGVDGERREEAVMQHMREQYGEARSSKEIIDEQCLPGEPVFGLTDLLTLSGDVPTAEELSSMLRDLVEMYRDKGGDQEVDHARIEEVMDEIDDFERSDENTAELLADRFTSRPNLQDDANRLVKPQIERMRRLAEAGGYLTFPDDPVPSRDDVPVPVPGMCYLFHTEGTYHVVMPKEVVPVARTLDWDEALAAASREVRFNAFFECAVDLRGIVELEEAMGEYIRSYSGRADEKDMELVFDEVYDELIHAMETEQVGATLLDTGKRTYLLHYELVYQYQEDRGEDPYTNELLLEGPLDRSLTNLLAHQRGKEPRPVTEEMLEKGSAFLWKMEQPPALALRDYLDLHVPDDADDYFFAEKVLEDVLEEQQFGIVKGSVQRFFNILEDNGFIPDEGQLHQLLDLWQNLCNGLPVWTNNGWSPNELQGRVSASSGRRMFFNPDGSIRKVGRNDPCPCGSGKKYKRCCGR